MILDVVKVIAPAAISFFAGIAITPVLTHYLYKYKMWKRSSGKAAGIGGGGTPIFNKLHKDKETGTPRMGGVIIWLSALITIVAIWLLALLFPNNVTEKLNFLDRTQTWLPLFTLIVGALIGLIDDLFEVYGNGSYIAGGLSLKKRLLVVFVIALIGAWWFFFKLGMHTVGIPFVGEIDIGILFIPFFITIMLALYSGGVIDGIDGLAGGVFMSIFSAYGVIAFAQMQINLAAFCFVVVGGLLAFLWFNIPPARFYMSETGTMGLTTSLAVVAFLTNQVILLPIIAFPLFITTLSNLIQVGSKRLRNGKKVFLVAPIHHHFEALGWPSYKVSMRYWIISIVFAIIGLILALIG